MELFDCKTAYHRPNPQVHHWFTLAVHRLRSLKSMPTRIAIIFLPSFLCGHGAYPGGLTIPRWKVKVVPLEGTDCTSKRLS
jgi:cell division septal protein FtsQ